MELFLIILSFIMAMTICFIIGEGLDPRFKLGRYNKSEPEKEEEDKDDLIDEVIEEQPETADIEEETVKDQEPCTDKGDGECEEEEDDVIRGCTAEVLETPEEMAERIAGFARECAENIARALGGNFVDISAYVVEPHEEAKDRAEEKKPL